MNVDLMALALSFSDIFCVLAAVFRGLIRVWLGFEPQQLHQSSCHLRKEVPLSHNALMIYSRPNI